MDKPKMRGSTGPRSDVGKLKASANASRHGLRGVGLLLGGETESEYREHLASWVQSLKPSSAAEVQIVSVLADLAWRQGRWLRIEYQSALADVEGRIAESKAQASITALSRASDAVGALVVATECGIPSCPTSAIPELASGAEKVIAIVEDAEDHPVMALLRLRKAIQTLEERASSSDWRSAYEEVGSTAVQLQRGIDSQLELIRQALVALRRKVETTALPADAELKRLGRYQSLLQKAMTAQLDILAVSVRRTAC